MATESTTSAVEQYVNDTIILTRSLTIKSEITADRINKAVIRAYGSDSVDLSSPRTWKYYLNICGKYHFTDTMMRVISLDTLQEIDFTAANMKIHTATAQAYKYGSRYYFSLVRKYPEQEMLILAITNPADMDQAVNRPDGSVLAYYSKYVEEQESTLIYELEQYIYAYLRRYTVLGFNNIWNRYPALNLAVLYTSLPAQIMNIRLKAVKTNRTHSFHIGQYLASHQRLDKYMPYMTLKQKLYLYHNIDMIEKYAGHNDIFDELVQWILTDRFIPIARYTVRQLQQFDDELYPELRARRAPINDPFNAAAINYFPLQFLYDKEAKIKPGNPRYLTHYKPVIDHKLAIANSSVIQTKDLESSMIDYTDSTPDTLPEVLLRQWIFMSGSGLYNAVVNFNDPNSGEPFSLLAKDALIYYCYVYMASTGQPVDIIPDVVNVKYRLHPRPNVTVLYRDLLDNFSELKDIADSLVSAQPIITECVSVSSFYELSYKIFVECQNQWRLKARTGDPMLRGVVAKMISRLFGISQVRLMPTETNMTQWLFDRNLPQFTGNYEEGLAYSSVIFRAATGYTLDETKSIRSVQKAMIEIFSQLSSYSIQVLREINESELIPVNWAAIRAGVISQESEESLNITAPVRVQGVDQQSQQTVYVDDGGDYVLTEHNAPDQDVRVNDEIYVSSCEGFCETTLYVRNSGITISDFNHDLDQNQPFHPMQYYDALTNQQRQTIADSLLTRN